MKFGFDIDDTLIDLRRHAFHIYNEKLNEQKSLDIFYAIKKVEIHEPFNLTNKEGNQMWKSSQNEIYFTNCPVFEGALEFLHYLKASGHAIFYITSRPKEHCEQTYRWMENQGFPMAKEQFYCGMQDDEKVAIIQDLQLDYYFDDKPAVLNTLQNTETKVFIKDQPYNQDVNGQRVIKWVEFSRYFIEQQEVREK